MKLRNLLTEMYSSLKVGNQPVEGINHIGIQIDRYNGPEGYIKMIDAIEVEI